MDDMSCDHPGGKERKHLRGLDTSLLVVTPHSFIVCCSVNPRIFLHPCSLGETLTFHLSVSI